MTQVLRSMIAVAAVLACCSAAAAQPAATAIDAMQPVAETAGGTLAIGGGSEQRLAQTFTVELAGRLAGAFLPVVCASGRLVIEIRDVVAGLPGDSVLARRAVSATHVASLGFHFQLFPLGGGVAVAPGDRLALVLANPTGSCGLARGPAGDSYPGGEAFFEALPNQPGWIPFSATADDHDLPFLAVVKAP
jgi:hypothetical protein